MKRNMTLTVSLMVITLLEAQLKESTISVAVVPTMGYRTMVYKGSFSSQYKDSLGDADHWRDAIGASLMLGIKSGRTNRIMVGLQFSNFGFTRRKNSIRFLDTVHPQIGIRSDQVQTGEDYVDFNYRYQYLTIPFLYSAQLGGKKLKSVNIHALFGGSVSGRLNHDIRAVLYGFSMRGNQKVFRLDNSDAQPALFNANLHFAMRLENLVYEKHTYVFVQPTFYFPLLPANYSSERHQLYALGIEVGIMFRPVKDKENK